LYPLSINDDVEFVVLRVDEEEKKISLGMKQTEEDPWLALPAKYPPATKITGVVRNLTSFGAFVEVEPGIDGLVHISDLSWTKRIKHPSEMFKKGDTVKAVVLNIDRENERFSLGLKQLTADPWTEIPKRYTPGTIIRGKVTSVTDFGIFLEVEEGIEGLIHVSEISQEKVDSPKSCAEVGNELEAVVLSVDTADRKIALSMKHLAAQKEKAEVNEFLGAQKNATSNLGDLLQGALGQNNSDQED